MYQIESSLMKRYPRPGWALFFEVRSNTQLRGSVRYADAIALSLFPSRGLDLYGFEVKRNRSDWLHELKNPEKAEIIANQCDFWFVVIPEPGIVKPEELPAPWGLMILRGERLRAFKKAERICKKDSPIQRPFFASLLRAAHLRSPEQIQLDEAKNLAFQEGYKAAAAGVSEAQTNLRSEVHHLTDKIRRFEEKSGVKLDNFGAGDVGDAVRWILDWKRTQSRLNVTVESLRHSLRNIQASVEDYETALNRLKTELENFEKPNVQTELQKDGDVSRPVGGV
jgi:hypothetical protein